MRDNSFGYVIIGLFVLAGSIIISFFYKKDVEEYNLIASLNGVKYEAVIYTNNKVIVGYESCLGDNCYVETKEYHYSKQKMNEFRSLLNKYSFEEYDDSRVYKVLLYRISDDKIIYDGDYVLVSLINNILLGEY